MSTSINLIDICMITISLLITLGLGLKSGIGKNINASMGDYAQGERNLSTIALSATLIASWISGNSTIGLVTEVHNQGWLFGLVFLAFLIGLMSTKYTLANRIHHFSGCYTTGDIIARIFGEKSQIITGLFTCFYGIGRTTAQLVSLGFIFNYLIGINTNMGILIGGGAIVAYTALGGIRAVITTDIIQFIILIIAVPLMLQVALSNIESYESIFNHTANIQYSEYDLWVYIALFLSFCIPRLYPAMVQKFLVARDTLQLYQSLNITFIIIAFVYVLMILIGVASISLYPDVADSSHVFAHIIQDLAPTGTKGFIIAALLAIIMSTADTDLNTGSIALVHDVIKKITTTKINEAHLVTLVTFIMGSSAILLAMQFTSILDAMLFTHLLWYPVMVCPLILGVRGLISNDKTFVASTIITIAAILIFHNTWSHNFALSTICGISFNLVTLISCQYIFNGSISFKVKEKFGASSKKTKTFDITLFNRIAPAYGTAYKILVFFILGTHLMIYLTWAEKTNPFCTTSISLSIISSVSCIAMMIYELWITKQEKPSPHLWYANLLFCLPFVNGFNLWAHNLDLVWVPTMLLVLWITSLLVNRIRFFILTVTGMTASFLLYKLLGGSLDLSSMTPRHASIYALIIFVIIGRLCIESKEEKRPEV